MARFSASQLQRVAACPASAVLPQVTHDSGAATRGTEIHDHQARVTGGMPAAESLALVAEEWRAVCAELEPGVGSEEVAFAYDVSNGVARIVGQNIGREYGALATTEIPGSTDLFGMVRDVIEITDYKTGRTEVEPAKSNLQLGHNALCAARVTGATKALVRLRHIKEDGSTWDDTAQLDAFDLDHVAKILQTTWDRVEEAVELVAIGRTPNVHEGAHCKYCPARAACPAKTAMLVQLASPDAVRAKFGALLTGATAAQAYALVERAGDLIGDLKAQLYSWARENPIDLGDGKVFGPVPSERETVKGDVAWEVLNRMHGAAVADQAVELSATKAGIEAALRTIAPPRGLSSLKKAALAEIEKAGGVEVKHSIQIKEHKAA